jgi:hypothetical protein
LTRLFGGDNIFALMFLLRPLFLLNLEWCKMDKRQPSTIYTGDIAAEHVDPATGNI